MSEADLNIDNLIGRLLEGTISSQITFFYELTYFFWNTTFEICDMSFLNSL